MNNTVIYRIVRFLLLASGNKSPELTFQSIRNGQRIRARVRTHRLCGGNGQRAAHAYGCPGGRSHTRRSRPRTAETRYRVNRHIIGPAGYCNGGRSGNRKRNTVGARYGKLVRRRRAVLPGHAAGGYRTVLGGHRYGARSGVNDVAKIQLGPGVMRQRKRCDNHHLRVTRRRPGRRRVYPRRTA